jgi:hypothetical protein
MISLWCTVSNTLCLPESVHHVVLFYLLLTKLTEWTGSNLSKELLIPEKIEHKRTAAELNNILLNDVVRGPRGHLCTFGGIKWECDLCNKRPKALLCYPFNIVGLRFPDINPQIKLICRIPLSIRYNIRCHIRLDIRYSIYFCSIRYNIRCHIRLDIRYSIYFCM